MPTGTITRFLVEKSKMEMTTGYFLKNEQDQENKLNICIKNNERVWSEYTYYRWGFFLFFITWKISMGWIRELFREKRQSTPKIHISGTFSTQDILKLQIFIANMSPLKTLNTKDLS